MLEEVMCIFSAGARVNVNGTSIFGRVHGIEQQLVYEMELAATDDVAMVLPLPIAAGHGDEALRFIDLSTYPKFFEALDLLFPQYLAFSNTAELTQGLGRGTIAVQRVGAFEASYVPTVADFSRLDRRFQLSSKVWNALPGYRDFGFAVFKLFQPKRGFLERIGIRKVEPAGPQPIHPMAFAFRTRMPDRVFFPTVHVHDGEVHSIATFDHTLYCQSVQPAGWERSEEHVMQSTLFHTKGVLADDFVYRKSMRGPFENTDVHADILV